MQALCLALRCAVIPLLIGAAAPASTATPTPTCSCPTVTPRPLQAGDELLVKTHLAPESLAFLMPGVDIVRQLEDRSAGPVYVGRVRQDVLRPQALGELRNRFGVRFEVNHRVRLLTPPTPNDPSFPQQSYLHNTGTSAAKCEDTDLNALEAWALLGRPPADLRSRVSEIAVVDSGVVLAEDELAGRLSPHRRNFAGALPDDNVEDDSSDKHGTEVAAIIAAEGDNLTKTAGVHWGTTLVPCKAVGPGDHVDAVLDCLNWVRDLIAVEKRPIAAVNASWEVTGCSCDLETAIRNLRDQGALLIAAAGNDGDQANNDNDPVYPASFPLSNILAVGGASPCGFESENYGPRSVHIAAAAGGIPTVRGKMLGGMQASSAAAAQASGVVALLQAADALSPTPTVAPGAPTPCAWCGWRNRIIAGGRPVPAQEGRTVSGSLLRAWDAPVPGETARGGALTCVDRVVQRRIWPRTDTVTHPVGAALTVRALSIRCAAPEPPGAAVVTGTDGAAVATIALADHGAAPDDFPDDGEWAGAWTPTAPGTYTIDFWGASGETLTVTVP